MSDTNFSCPKLYSFLLDWGIELSLPHKVEIIDGKRIHVINGNKSDADLIACLEENISEKVVKKNS